MSPTDSELSNVARARMSEEFTDSVIYDRLSSTVEGSSPFAEVLKQLALTEGKHREFWNKYVPDEKPRLDKVKLYWILILRRVLGLTFASRYLDRHETSVVKQYEAVAGLIPPADMDAFNKMVEDERSHELELTQRVESTAVRYISFIVLGLADSLVEISGIHAGSLGIYDKTEIAGLAGVVAGAAASMAMASAAYAQAKQGFKGSAKMSAVYTGVSYFVSAVFLATPYFLTQNMILALSTSLGLAIVQLALTTYYSTVITNKPFTKDFVEILAILLGATVALYAFGYIVHVETNIKV